MFSTFFFLFAILPLFAFTLIAENDTWELQSSLLATWRMGSEEVPYDSRGIFSSDELIGSLGATWGGAFSFAYRSAHAVGVEWAFRLVDPWQAKGSSNPVCAPFSFGFDPYENGDYWNASAYELTYASHFGDTELNIRRYSPWMARLPFQENSWLLVAGLAGMHYLYVGEESCIRYHNLNQYSDYQIKTGNQILASQVGAELEVQSVNGSLWGCSTKLGVDCNFASQEQEVRDQNNSIWLRDCSMHAIQIGGLFAFDMHAGILLGSFFVLELGYNFLYLFNLATADGQVERSLIIEDCPLLSTSDLYIQSALLGIRASF